jgi:hypothetical protein
MFRSPSCSPRCGRELLTWALAKAVGDCVDALDNGSIDGLGRMTRAGSPSILSPLLDGVVSKNDKAMLHHGGIDRLWTDDKTRAAADRIA